MIRFKDERFVPDEVVKAIHTLRRYCTNFTDCIQCRFYDSEYETCLQPDIFDQIEGEKYEFGLAKHDGNWYVYIEDEE